MNQECYICGKEFPESEGIYQTGRNQMRIDQLAVRRRFCCDSCAKKGRRNFVVAHIPHLF